MRFNRIQMHKFTWVIMVFPILLFGQGPDAPLPLQKEAKQFMKWFTESYMNKVGYEPCINENLEVIDENLMVADSLESPGGYKYFRPEFYGAFPKQDSNFVCDQMKQIIRRSRWYDSTFQIVRKREDYLHFSNGDSQLIEGTPTYINSQLMHERWSRDFISTKCQLLPDTAIHYEYHILISGCGQWVSYPLFSQNREWVLVKYVYFSSGLNAGGATVLFKKRGKRWKKVRDFDRWIS